MSGKHRLIVLNENNESLSEKEEKRRRGKATAKDVCYVVHIAIIFNALIL